MTDGDEREDPGEDCSVEDDPDGETPIDEFGIPGDESVDPTADDAAPNEQPDTAGESAVDEGGVDDDAPLSSLAESVDRRRDRNRGRDRPDDQLFSEESVQEIDTDVVWERLDEDEPPELPDRGERDVRVIEKRSYCEQCPFFSAPPEVGCTHEGTEILELVDMDHFRVVDCPKVVENERLERL